MAVSYLQYSFKGVRKTALCGLKCVVCVVLVLHGINNTLVVRVLLVLRRITLHANLVMFCLFYRAVST